MNHPRSAAVIAALALIAAPSTLLAQGPAKALLAADPAPKAAARGASVFRCDGGRELSANFGSQGARAVAIVDVGDGPHVLDLKPWNGGVPTITWGDGQRTLTWSTGVQLMWMDGSTHLMCGRGGHSH